MNIKLIIIPFVTIMLVFASPLNTSHAYDYTTIDEYLYPEPEKTVSMDFTDAQMINVLKIFSQQSGLNFIASSEIANKTVNLYLEDVPVEEALERILSANNLTYEIKPESNIFVVKEVQVAPIQMMTRVYPLKFATVPSSKLYSTLSSSDEESGGAAGLSPGSATGPASGILGAVESILTEDGSVVEDTRTNSLIVTDIPSQFPLIEQTIVRLDIRVPQILIEAELLDISKQTADLIGPKFGDTPITFTGAQRDHVYPFNQNDLFRKGYVFEDAEYRVGTLSFQGLAITLQFLRTQTDTRNLARPRILTLNNESAEIAISTDEAIGLQSTTTASEGTSESVAEAERVETGVFLKVTPQANIYTREITMAIEPRVIQARTGSTFGGQTFKDPEERGTKSILRVHDGDTVIIGGLIRTDTDNIGTHVPVISKIPILGAAFRHKDNDTTERELIIFITPHILEEEVRQHASRARSTNIIREQSKPSNRNKVIESALSKIEQARF